MIDTCLKLDGRDLESLREKGVLLSKTDQVAAAAFLTAVARDHPQDAGSLLLLGDVHRDAWVQHLARDQPDVQSQGRVAVEEVARLDRAIATYTDAFLRDPGCFEAGLKAATFLRLRRFLLPGSGAEGCQAAGDAGRLVRPDVPTDRLPDPGRRRGRALGGPRPPGRRRLRVTRRPRRAGNPLRGRDRHRSGRRSGRRLPSSTATGYALETVRRRLLILKGLGYQATKVDAALEVLDGGDPAGWRSSKSPSPPPAYLPLQRVHDRAAGRGQGAPR